MELREDMNEPASEQTVDEIPGPPPVDLDDSACFVNRELSWLRFNDRVLEEALSETNPLLERLKFLSIFACNLDEFFMIRVSGLRKQLEAGTIKAPPDGMTPAEQIAAIRSHLLPILDRAHDCWKKEILRDLRTHGINILDYGELKKRQLKLMRRHFKSEILPVLTPLAFDPGHPFPHISNLSINLAVTISDAVEGQRFARLKVPLSFPRLVRIPSEEKAESFERLGLEELGSTTFVWIEDIITANLDLLFPGLTVDQVWPFRVTRDADLEIEEDEAADLLTAMREVIGQRQFGSAIRLEVEAEMPNRIRKTLEKNLGVSPYQVYKVDSPLGLADLMMLTRLDRPDLKDPGFMPSMPPELSTDENIFSVIKRKSLILYHPYDSFAPVVDFIRAAASDPKVLAIKQTLYRLGPNSPIIEALMNARENGKQVAVLVELKARFDEENNIIWAKALERAGVHVVYGVVGLKTHAKMCLVVRRENNRMTRYVHLSTGNYNPITANIYTDIGIFTSDNEIAKDVSDLFNALTGYSGKTRYRKLLVAPKGMRAALLERIEREIEHHQRDQSGRIIFKMNALVDKACIKALYRASQAGVPIELQVRGICCLRPGVEGLSENIRVTSIVGRFLEHTRIYFFHNGGNPELYLGSADLMPRNLGGRVETLFPIEDAALKSSIIENILNVHLSDNVAGRIMETDDTYRRLEPGKHTEAKNSQTLMIRNRGMWHPEI